MVKYEDITVQLISKDGNAFSIMAAVTRAMRKAKIPQTEINEYLEEAQAGDYNHLLRVTMNTVNVE